MQSITGKHYNQTTHTHKKEELTFAFGEYAAYH